VHSQQRRTYPLFASGKQGVGNTPRLQLFFQPSRTAFVTLLLLLIPQLLLPLTFRILLILLPLLFIADQQY